MVARTHSAPSSNLGMNSPPMKGTSRSVAPKITAATDIVNHGRSRHQANFEPYQLLTASNGRLTLSFTPLLNQYDASTGTKVRVSSNAPSNANDIVSAI